MLKPSKAATERATEALKAQFVKGGLVDEAAIHEYAEKQAARLWIGKHVIYASQDAMAAGFAAEIISRVKS